MMGVAVTILQSAFVTILKAVISKKVFILLVKKIAESTENKIDDNVVDIVEGSLYKKIDLTRQGVEGLLEEVVPEIVEKWENRNAQGGLGEK